MRIMFLAVATLAFGCGSKKKAEGIDQSALEPAPVAGSGSGSGSGSTGSGSGSGSGTAAPKPIVIKDAGLSTPESVLYDPDSDTYLVSNINGDAGAADDNGFITRISAETQEVKDPKWIDGAKPDVKLDAPKGMAISGGVLWVADLTVVRKFDAKTGKPMGEVKIEGATFLNDVAPAPDGGIYISDTGIAFKDGKPAPTGSDAVYAVSKAGKVTPLVKNKELGGPNGVIAVGDAVWCVTFGKGEIFSVPAKGGAASKPVKLPKGQLDGIVALDDGDFLVSSWEGNTVYRGKGETWKDLDLHLEAPADIGFDTKRKRLLVPAFTSNQIWIYEIQ